MVLDEHGKYNHSLESHGAHAFDFPRSCHIFRQKNCILFCFTDKNTLELGRIFIAYEKGEGLIAMFTKFPVVFRLEVEVRRLLRNVVKNDYIIGVEYYKFAILKSFYQLQ